LTVKPLRQ